MNPAVLANLRQITLAGMRVSEISREIRRSVAIGDGVAVARDAATLATLSARILSAESALRQELQKPREPRHCPCCDSIDFAVTGHCAACDHETEVVL